MALINSLRSLPRLISKDSFSQLVQWIKGDGFKDVTGSELFYQLTYMSAIASSGIARNRIFQMAASLPISPAPYFERIQLLVQKIGYDYIRACNSVGQSVKSEAMASLLLRMGNAFTAGQREQDSGAAEERPRRSGRPAGSGRPVDHARSASGRDKLRNHVPVCRCERSGEGFE